MKKLFALLAVLVLSVSMAFAASPYSKVDFVFDQDNGKSHLDTWAGIYGQNNMPGNEGWKETASIDTELRNEGSVYFIQSTESAGQWIGRESSSASGSGDTDLIKQVLAWQLDTRDPAWNTAYDGSLSFSADALNSGYDVAGHTHGFTGLSAVADTNSPFVYSSHMNINWATI